VQGFGKLPKLAPWANPSDAPVLSTSAFVILYVSWNAAAVVRNQKSVSGFQVEQNFGIQSSQWWRVFIADSKNVDLGFIAQYGESKAWGKILVE